MEFKNTTEAFEFLYKEINATNELSNGTKAIYNCIFTILDVKDNVISTKERKFNIDYAKKEWEWYLSGNRNANEISKIAKIWLNHMDEEGNVNSNYGWQWNRNRQIDYVVNELNRDRSTRRALITIYDGKEHLEYSKDTPCTLNIQFYFKEGDERLHMTVLMRSNDLWYGFCNDSYTFIELQKVIANKLNVECGTYTHFAQNMHIYKKHFNKF